MSKTKQLILDDYAILLAEVKERVSAAQYDALKAVNKELVALYWDIGRDDHRTPGCWRTRHCCGQTTGRGFTGGVSRHCRLLLAQSLQHERILCRLSRQAKIATIGCNNRMDPKPRNPPALQTGAG
jgi:hypothetical protein